jgi:hypothetical protein
MTVASALDAGLAMLVLGVAGWTVGARQTFAAVIGFVAFGLLLAQLAGATVSQMVARTLRRRGQQV